VEVAGFCKKLEFSRLSNQTSYYYVTFHDCIRRIIDQDNKFKEKSLLQQQYQKEIFSPKGTFESDLFNPDLSFITEIVLENFDVFISENNYFSHHTTDHVKFFKSIIILENMNKNWSRANQTKEYYGYYES